jgi:phage I-like protein
MKTPYEVTMTDSGPRFAVLLGALADGAKRIPIAVVGKFSKGAQKFAITLQTLSDLVSNFRRRPIDTEIDFEHASEFPEVAQGGPIPAAGWLTAVDDAPDAQGILWGLATFTARAAAMISAGEYRYISPVIDYGARDKHSGEAQGATLVSLALTNRPFLESLPALAMSARVKDRGASQAMLLADIETEIAAKRAANKNLDYARAWSLVAIEKPDLIAAYNAAGRRVSASHAAGINYGQSW